MKISDIIEICQIFNGYLGWYIWADHDLIGFARYDNDIYIGCDNEIWNMYRGDQQRLEQMGVFYSEEYDSLVVYI